MGVFWAEEVAGGAETVIDDGVGCAAVVVVGSCFRGCRGENAAVVGVVEAVDPGCCWL